MKISIYQINPERDSNHVMFMDLDNTRHFQDSHDPDACIYDKVFTGTVDCLNLEQAYAKFNMAHPAGFTGRSLSVSDVVEVEDAASITPGYYFCDSIGFREIAFQPELATDRTGADTIQVVLLEPGKTARVIQLEHTLESMQKIVGGDIEAFYPFEEQVCIVCNV